MSNEFDIIKRYFQSHLSSRSDIVIGIGDDGAVLNLRDGEQLVVSADTLVEGVHFSRGICPEWVGHKSLAVNLSDMAAMGAEPAWATLALTLPEIDESWISDFCNGFFALADQYQVGLVGGDITQGPLSITVNIMGYVSPEQAIKRDGAMIGDVIFVTGNLGEAGLAWLANDNQVNLSEDEMLACARRLHTPQPRVEAGLALRGIANAAIDISDGMLADLSHILEASGVGGKINIEKIPVSPAVQKRLSRSVDWLQPVTTGDDYELLFCVPQQHLADLAEKFQGLGCSITEIGEIESNPGLHCYYNNNLIKLPQSLGYQHFQQAERSS